MESVTGDSINASAFSNAVGFWRDGRNALWEEKLGIGIPFTGNEATEWGTKTEDEACEAYAALTNASVSHLLFRALSPDEAELWMGASPDGLVVAATTDAAEYNADVLNSGDTIDSLNNNERGILEVKCPFNRGETFGGETYSESALVLRPASARIDGSIRSSVGGRFCIYRK